ncbi:cytochrome b-c1 complex subunit Rieske, mitochondrial-like [Lytechinus variegatus]|uniref:cytochrome b-c1 complex subunit Rieske, mitochondrial-like n=1 Tax=Lytechinus variegatus TaxID=7654 RepID=UPI001BB119DB|nr:cytochrome b-c1 complex subunit Rieske, mitochondrial-like [Lytechinus variegatus]
MFSAVSKVGVVAPFVSATAQNVGSQLRQAVVTAPTFFHKFTLPEKEDRLTSEKLGALLPKSHGTRATCGVQGAGQVRFAHTDIQVPDFSEYRRDQSRDPQKPASTSSTDRQMFSYLLVGGGSIAAAYSAKNIVTDFIQTMNASADVLAMAKIEIKLEEIPEGKNMTFKWRGKPLFVRHRTQEEIDEVVAVDVGSLRDPQHDKERVQKDEWLVLIGVCTHLGCVPIANAGEYGGYYCPCHGSHYDASGRIRKGPAPLNLEIPEYAFPTDDLLVVG